MYAKEQAVRNVLEAMVFGIVDNPTEVSIVEEKIESGFNFKISVAKEDVGKLIGTKGRIAGALRTIIKAAGAKNGVRVLVNIDKEPVKY